MRPGRLTPENHRMAPSLRPVSLRFNEAGAINPGKPSKPMDVPTNELLASMRPGRLTPENLNFLEGRREYRERFNEAGAINPGKPGYPHNPTHETTYASMRPGRLTPENRFRRGRQWEIALPLQ